MNRRRFTSHGLVIVSVLVIAASLSSPTMADNGELVLESRDSPYARLSRLSAQDSDDGVIVSGEVRKISRSRGLVPGSLMIEVISPDGRVLAEVASRYKRRSPRSISAWFITSVPDPGEAISSVRVSHHPPASWGG